MADIVSRLCGEAGELVLRSSGPHFEIIANGTFLMDTRAGTSERLLATAAADRMPAAGRMLIGGLGVGFSLRAALDHPRVAEILVVEREPAIITWNHGPLRTYHDDALADPRVHCVQADLVTWLPACHQHFDAICLDIDNGPEWTVNPTNAPLYTDTGLASLAAALTPGGILTIWSAADSADFATRLHTHFTHVEVLPIPVPRGEPDIIYLAHTNVAGH